MTGKVCLSEGVMDVEQVCSLLVECWVDMPERLKAGSRCSMLDVGDDSCWDCRIAAL